MRQLLCSKCGVGFLYADNRLHTDVSYLIECWRESNGAIRMDGIIDVEPTSMEQTCSSEDVILLIDTGEKVRVKNACRDSAHVGIEVHGYIAGCARLCGSLLPPVTLPGDPGHSSGQSDQA